MDVSPLDLSGFTGPGLKRGGRKKRQAVEFSAAVLTPSRAGAGVTAATDVPSRKCYVLL